MKLKRIRLQRILISISHFFSTHSKKIFWGIIFILLFLLFSKINQVLKNHQLSPKNLVTFFDAPQENLDQINGRTNFLLLGIRGEDYVDVPDLADTIMIFSYNHSSSQFITISIPRDLWISSLKTKINSVYHYGQQNDPQNGIQLTEAAILEILGIPIHYTAVVDFTGFTQAIDLFDGIEVDVEQAFTDPEFPIPGNENTFPIIERYESLHFDAGPQIMDGETALKYVRSRHSQGNEGTDFARSCRQQNLIKALSHRLLFNDLLNKDIRDGLYSIAEKNLNTSITSDLYPTLLRLALDSRNQSIVSLNLSTEPDEDGISILENPPAYLYQNQWVLIPKDNNSKALKQYLENKLKEN